MEVEGVGFVEAREPLPTVDPQASASYFSAMTLQFQLRREDVVAFNQAFYDTSPTYQKVRARTRWAMPLVMALLELVLTMEDGFQWPRSLFFGAIALGWFLAYPKRFDARVRKYAEKTLAEPAFARMLGAYTLTLTNEGLHAVWPMAPAPTPGRP